MPITSGMAGDLSSRVPAPFRAKTERLLRRPPRTLEVLCALVLIGLAFEFLSEVVFAEWFYAHHKNDYAYTLAYRVGEWIYGVCVVLLSVWMFGMAWNLLRGTSRRSDHGLFSPTALRIWGLLFGIMPVLMLVCTPGAALAHFHVLLWCLVAAAACFTLAARRLHPNAPETGPPPPIE